MSFKEKLENNPIKVILISSFTFGSIVWSVSAYFNNIEINKKETICTEKISRINLVSSDSCTINLSKLIVGKNENIEKLENLEFYSTDNFYAEKNNSIWEYFSCNEVNLLGKISDMSSKDIDDVISSDEYLQNLSNDTLFKQKMQMYPLHLWRYKVPVEFVCEGQSVKFHPYITVQRFDELSMKYIAETTFNAGYASEKLHYKLTHQGRDFDSLKLDTLKVNYFHNLTHNFFDILFYEKFISYMTYFMTNGIKYEINKLIKKEDYAYAKLIWEFSLCRNELRNRSFYFIEEFFTLKVGSCFYSICFKIPSLTPNSSNKVYSEILSQLTSFKFVK